MSFASRSKKAASFLGDPKLAKRMASLGAGEGPSKEDKLLSSGKPEDDRAPSDRPSKRRRLKKRKKED